MHKDMEHIHKILDEVKEEIIEQVKENHDELDMSSMLQIGAMAEFYNEMCEFKEHLEEYSETHSGNEEMYDGTDMSHNSKSVRHVKEEHIGPRR